YEVAPGQLVEIPVAELERIAPADRRTIDVHAIVAHDAIGTLQTTKGFFVIPGRTGVAREGYAALAHALHREGLAGLCRFVAWNAEHVAVMHSDGLVLALQELAGELRDDTAIRELVDGVELSDRTWELARKLVRRLEVPYTPELAVKRHHQRVAQLVDAAIAGGAPIVHADEEPVPPPASVDLAGA